VRIGDTGARKVDYDGMEVRSVLRKLERRRELQASIAFVGGRSTVMWLLPSIPAHGLGAAGADPVAVQLCSTARKACS
jgi:hypothetical protein